MGELGGETIVAVWERARQQHPIDRALTLLGLACPARSRDDLARMPLGERDRLLFELREQLFGPRLELAASCPACREASEFEVALRDLVVTPPPGPLVVDAGGQAIAFRLPDSVDLAHAVADPDPAHGRRALVARCVVGGPEVLDDAALDALAAAFEAHDPQAEVRFALTCIACGHAWKPVLDIGELTYAELAAAARALVGEVHALATAYKWREADILAMTPARRRWYLEMVGDA